MTDYTLMIKQAEALAEGCMWDITLYANISALLFESLNDINWAGFYLIRNGELQLGPFQGKTACTRIPIGNLFINLLKKDWQSITAKYPFVILIGASL